jgi:membrane-associated phospholipid phosphatase
MAHEPVFAAVDTLELELLSCFDRIPMPDFGWENDLAFRRYPCRHERKISSYLTRVNGRITDPSRKRRPVRVIAVLFFAILFLSLWAVMYAAIPPLARSVRAHAGRLAGWLRGHARVGRAFGHLEAWRSYLPLVVALVSGTLIVVGAADAFTDIAAALRAHNPIVQHVDATIYEWFSRSRTPFMNVLFVGITTSGSAVAMGLVVALTAIILTARRRFRWAAYLGITAVGGVLLNQLLKLHFARQRPDLMGAILGADGYSFPSGHTMGGTIVLGALGYLAARSTPTWKGKSAVLAALATADLAIAISRLYLGVHWTSDVLAGLAAGLLWVAATTTAYELVRQYRLQRSSRARDRTRRVASED